MPWLNYHDTLKVCLFNLFFTLLQHIIHDFAHLAFPHNSAERVCLAPYCLQTPSQTSPSLAFQFYETTDYSPSWTLCCSKLIYWLTITHTWCFPTFLHCLCWSWMPFLSQHAQILNIDQMLVLPQLPQLEESRSAISFGISPVSLMPLSHFILN